MLGTVLRAAVAALALNVTGFVIGKVVGDYYIYLNRTLAWIGGSWELASTSSP